MRRDRSIVDADIEGAKTCQRFGNDGMRAIFGADIGDQRNDPLGIETSDRFGQSFGVAVGSQYLRAAFGKAMHHRSANTASAASDDNDLVTKIERDVHHFLRWDLTQSVMRL